MEGTDDIREILRQVNNASRDIEEIKTQIATSTDIEDAAREIEKKRTWIKQLTKDIEKTEIMMRRDIERHELIEKAKTYLKGDVTDISNQSTYNLEDLRQFGEVHKEIDKIYSQTEEVMRDIEIRRTEQFKSIEKGLDKQTKQINEDLRSIEERELKKSNIKKRQREIDDATVGTQEVSREAEDVSAGVRSLETEFEENQSNYNVLTDTENATTETLEVSREIEDIQREISNLELESMLREIRNAGAAMDIRKIQIKLEVISDTPVSPGSVVRFCLRVLKPADYIIRINLLKVSFQGKGCFAHIRYIDADLARGRMGELSQNHLSNINNRSEKYVTWCKMIHSRGDSPFVVEREGTLAPIFFEMELPKNIPDSWIGGAHGRIKYSMVTELRYSELDTERGENMPKRLNTDEIYLKKKTELRVRQELHAGQLGFDKPMGTIIQRELPDLGLPGRRGGRLEVQFWLASRATVPGGKVLCNVQIDNCTSHSVKKAKVTLYQEYILTVGGTSTQPITRTTRYRLDKVKMDSFKDGFSQSHVWLHMPGNAATQFSFNSCSIVTVRYYVRLYVRWNIGSVRHWFPIFVATTGVKELQPDLRNPALRYHQRPISPSSQEVHRSRSGSHTSGSLHRSISPTGQEVDRPRLRSRTSGSLHSK